MYRPARSGFQFDTELTRSLEEMAIREQRPVDEMAANLMAYAVVEHDNDQVYLKRWNELSPREQEVAALVCLGYTNSEIGRRLFISTETVKSHTKHILGKFNMRRKLDLMKALARWDFSEWDKS